MIMQEEAQKLVEEHGSMAAAARVVGMKESTFKDRLHGKKPGRLRLAPAILATTPARTLVDFRKEHDQTWKIRDGIKRMFSGGVIMTDSEFREAVCGNPSRWRAAADATEFKDNRYRVQGELLWASAETIREMRKIRGEVV